MPVDTSMFSLISGFVVTPSDATTFQGTVRAIWVGGAGDVAVRMARDQSVLTIKGVQIGTLLPLCVDRIMATNTTATNLLALT
jgi:hypothetical protein